MSYQFPENLFFDKKHHVWCLPESDLLIRIGIDPLGLASLGDLAYLSLNQYGSQVVQGQPMGMLEASKMTDSSDARQNVKSAFDGQCSPAP